MRIETSKGKSFDVRFIGPALRTNKVLIELEDERPIAQIAEDFDGLESIKKTDEAIGESVYEMFTGYKRLVSITMNEKAGTVRITLERDDVK